MKRTYLVLFIALMLLTISACDAKLLSQTPRAIKNTAEVPQSAESEPAPAPQNPADIAPALAQALVDFRLGVPDETDPTDTIYLTILDEVTGLYLNAARYPLSLDDTTGVFSTQLPFPVGSVVKYRYERQGNELLVAEHSSDGSPVRYRMLVVDGPMSTDDVVSRWTDTEYTFASGRIMGNATDAVSGAPIPNLLITAGGAQTYSTSDGSYLIEGLPPGIHNLVGYAMDGSYQTFQQGAEVAADSTTPAPMSLTPATFVNVTFEVVPPGNTPPVVPLRIAGNLTQLGNTFGTLTGGVSTLATRMPVLSPLPDGGYGITMQLPAGADLRYKYTLGDGYWNAEHKADTSFRLRQLIVPNQDTKIQDVVDTWQTDPGATVTFDLTVPENTPAGDFVSIQLNPLFGWTEPIPMWSLGGNRWAYVLYSPLNLPGNLSYRYCRNNQCGIADDSATPGLFGAGKTVNLDQLPQQIKESVQSWANWNGPIDPAGIPIPELTPRGPDFKAGVEILPEYHPSWQSLLPPAFMHLNQIGTNWVVYDPTWTITRSNPPVMEPIAGQDPLWADNFGTIQNAHNLGLKLAMKPTLTFDKFPTLTCSVAPCPTSADAWWQESARDFGWWLVWFDHYRDFILHHADLAAQSGAEALILGGDWVSPALPGGLVMDGQPSGTPTETEARWRSLIADVRERYPGKIIWSMPYSDALNAPAFMDAVDEIQVEWQIEPGLPDTPVSGTDELASLFGQQLDEKVQAIQSATSKPVFISLSAPSEPNLDYQLAYYQAMIQAVNAREWISGFVSGDFFPAAELQDLSASIHGKSAEVLLQNSYPVIVGPQP